MSVWSSYWHVAAWGTDRREPTDLIPEAIDLAVNAGYNRCMRLSVWDAKDPSVASQSDVMLDSTQATELRDALTRFIETGNPAGGYSNGL